ncbi:hypothetical protein J6590_054074 [Homalodisca vitripennis]|nr:hypothetical protein J6590_054074 [Homalodisca vitripennis]
MPLKVFAMRWLLSGECGAERGIKMVPHLNEYKTHLEKDPGAPKPPDTHSIREIIDEDLSDESNVGVQSDIEAENFPEDYPALEDFSGSGEEYIPDFDNLDPSDQEIENVPGPSPEPVLRISRRPKEGKCDSR